MARGRKLDRRGNGPWWFIALAFVLFCLYSLAVAGATAEDCGEDAPKHWEFFPPAWECENR